MVFHNQRKPQFPWLENPKGLFTKRLISLTSTKGKTNKQAAKEVFKSVQKYLKVERQVEASEPVTQPQIGQNTSTISAGESAKTKTKEQDKLAETLSLTEQLRQELRKLGLREIESSVEHEGSTQIIFRKKASISQKGDNSKQHPEDK